MPPQKRDKKFELNASVHYGGKKMDWLTSSSGPTSSLFNTSSVWSSRMSKLEGSLRLWWWWWWWWWCRRWWSCSRRAARRAWYPFSSDERDKGHSALPWDFPALFDSSCLRKLHSKSLQLLGAVLGYVETPIILISIYFS